MSDWISVDVGIPKTSSIFRESSDVLVCGDTGTAPAVCWYNSETEAWYISHHIAPSTEVGGITHWMPLPEPPQ